MVVVRSETLLLSRVKYHFHSIYFAYYIVDMFWESHTLVYMDTYMYFIELDQLIIVSWILTLEVFIKVNLCENNIVFFLVGLTEIFHTLSNSYRVSSCLCSFFLLLLHWAYHQRKMLFRNPNVEVCHLYIIGRSMGRDIYTECSATDVRVDNSNVLTCDF